MAAAYSNQVEASSLQSFDDLASVEAGQLSGQSSSLADGYSADKGHNVGGDVVTFVTSDLERNLDGFVSHPQGLFLSFSVRYDFRQRWHEDGIAALGFRPQVDRVLQCSNSWTSLRSGRRSPFSTL